MRRFDVRRELRRLHDVGGLLPRHFVQSTGGQQPRNLRTLRRYHRCGRRRTRRRRRIERRGRRRVEREQSRWARSRRCLRPLRSTLPIGLRLLQHPWMHRRSLRGEHHPEVATRSSADVSSPERPVVRNGQWRDNQKTLRGLDSIESAKEEKGGTEVGSWKRPAHR